MLALTRRRLGCLKERMPAAAHVAAATACAAADAHDCDTVVASLAQSLASKGLTIVAPFKLAWYNEQPHVRTAGAGVAERSPAGAEALCVLLGNSREVWDPFIAHCSRERAWLEAAEDPLDDYCETAVLEALRSRELSAHAGRCRIIWVHKQTEHRASGAGWVSAQAMATAAGLAALEARSHLLMHPVLGPWLSLRSVLVFDAVRAPFAAPPRAVPLELSREVEERLRESLAARDAQPAASGAMPRWRRWLAVRDALAPSHPWRFCAAQIDYHYTCDRAVLLTSAVKFAESQEQRRLASVAQRGEH